MSGTEFITGAQLRRELGMAPKPGDEYEADRRPPATTPNSLPGRRNKYGVAPAEERTYEGIVFHSKGEMERWCALLWEERAGLITDLDRQVSFDLHVGDVRIGRIVLDFVYTRDRRRVYEDFKSEPTRTRLFRWKAKHFTAQYGAEITISERRAA